MKPLAALPDLNDCSDAELAALCAQGQVEAFEPVMRRHNRLLFRTARAILRSDEDAQDVLQEAYLKAWHALARFRGEARLSTWLVRIVVNEAVSRRRGPEAVLTLVEEPDEEAADEADPGPDALLMRGQMRALMERRIDALPEAFRTVFMLRAVEELSAVEVAELLQLPEATVRTRYFRARAALREMLAQDIDLATADAFAFAGARCDRIVARVMARLRR
jgi:RNA polymerase sigma-70 factor (ECF subfamily)